MITSFGLGLDIDYLGAISSYGMTRRPTGYVPPVIVTPEVPGSIARAFSVDNRPIRLLRNEIAERKRLKRKIAADRRLSTMQRRRAEEEQILAMYAMVRKAA
jgi:hypothetical protein